jgi:hypothetical protein
MTSLNGVHALLAFLAQHTHATKADNGSKLDVAQLDALLDESRMLNERLLRIEKYLSAIDKSEAVVSPAAQPLHHSPDGSWPAASQVRDTINSQERHQSFGYSDLGNASANDAETLSYHDPEGSLLWGEIDGKSIVLHRYASVEEEQTIIRHSPNFGFGSDTPAHPEAEWGKIESHYDRLLLIAIGFSLLLCAFYLSFT